jgi:hypothetical protein
LLFHTPPRAMLKAMTDPLLTSPWGPCGPV